MYSKYSKNLIMIFARKVFILLAFMTFLCLVNTNNVYAESPAPPKESTKFISDTCTLSHQYPVPNSITYDLSGTSKLYILCSYNTGGCQIVDYNKFNVCFSNSSNSNLWNKDFKKNTTAEIDVESALSFLADEAKKDIKITISPIYGCIPVNDGTDGCWYDYAFYVSASIRGEPSKPKFNTNSYVQSNGNLTRPCAYIVFV